MSPAQLAGGDHAAHAPADAQLAVQPDRQRSTRAPNSKRSPTSCSTPTLAILSDEIYEQLIYGDAKPTCFATLRPGLPSARSRSAARARATP